jgi:hypothetical protein
MLQHADGQESKYLAAHLVHARRHFSCDEATEDTHESSRNGRPSGQRILTHAMARCVKRPTRTEREPLDTIYLGQSDDDVQMVLPCAVRRDDAGSD